MSGIESEARTEAEKRYGKVQDYATESYQRTVDFVAGALWAVNRNPEPPIVCTALGCAGDGRYAARGRGHMDGCTHPVLPAADDYEMGYAEGFHDGLSAPRGRAEDDWETPTAEREAMAQVIRDAESDGPIFASTLATAILSAGFHRQHPITEDDRGEAEAMYPLDGGDPDTIIALRSAYRAGVAREGRAASVADLREEQDGELSEAERLRGATFGLSILRQERDALLADIQDALELIQPSRLMKTTEVEHEATTRDVVRARAILERATLRAARVADQGGKR